MKRFSAYASAFALFILLALSALADSMTGAWGISPAQPRSYGEPPLRAANTAAAVVAKLEAASEADIAALRQYNRGAGNGPARVAIVHKLARPVVASRGVGIASNEPFRWRGAVSVAGAHRLRLELTGVNAPADAKFWVYGTDGQAYGFDLSLAYQGTIWTPSVEGDTITIEVEATGTSAPFTISSVANIREAAEVVPMDASCIEDAKCYTGLDELGSAIAHMQYMSGGSGYICTGGLIIDSQKTFKPYFLTANHCIATAAEAASLETYWDFKAATCNGTASLSGKPKVTGSTILATTEATDMSLLQLTSVPGSRFFLGWTTNTPATGATLYRLSHPQGQPLRFSTASVITTGGTCQGWPRPNFIYQTHVIGTTAGGSSGSPVVNDQAQIVGQLAGACGPDPSDPCNHGNRTVDGALSASYELIKQYINPGAPITPPCSPCTPNANTACMLNGRFKVTMTWSDPSANLSGTGRLINYADNRPVTNPADGEISQVTFWSMYAHDPNSVEALVRMLRGGSSFWIFMTGFAAAEYTVTVQDTKNCTTWQRTSPFGSKEKIVDYNALPF